MAKYKLRWPITRDECDECGHTSTRLRRPWRKVVHPSALTGLAAILNAAAAHMEYNSPIFSLEGLAILPVNAKVIIPRVGEYSFAEKP